MSPRAQAGLGLGANLANDPPPDLPTEPRTIDIEAWRARNEARRGRVGRASLLEAAAIAAAAAPVCPGEPEPARPVSRVEPADARHAAAAAAYLAGDSTLTLGARYGVCRTTISAWLKAAGVSLRPPGGHHAPAPEPGPGGVVDQPAPQLVPDPASAVAAPASEEPRACRLCGCMDERACPSGCSWVGPDLCSACAHVTPATFHTTEAAAPDAVDALQDVVDATHLLLDTTPEAMATSLHHLQGLIAGALAVLGHPTTPPTTGA